MLKLRQIATIVNSNMRSVQTVPDRVLEKHRYGKLNQAINKQTVDQKPAEPFHIESGDVLKSYKEAYPDFLPSPVYYFRDKIREKLERQDMMNRRKNIIIPEFYVGSILAVNASDPYAPEKLNRFVGICIRRDSNGLRHMFTLRNVVDGTAIEIIYELYNPTLQSIEVLKLEKRLDDNLSYLRDCPLEYSTVPFDMQPVRLPPGAKASVNPIRVPLNPKPWHQRWERKPFLKGLILPPIPNSEYAKFRASNNDFKPFERYDLMKNYRETIHDTDLTAIVGDLKKFESEQVIKREMSVGSRKLKRLRDLPTDN